MAYPLTKKITRATNSQVYDRGKTRNLILTVEPSSKGTVLGVRVSGTRQTYRLGLNSVYVMAIRNYEDKIERRVKQIMKLENKSQRSARAQAKAEAAKELAS